MQYFYRTYVEPVSDLDPEPDRQALDSDADLNPAKWYISDRIPIRNHNSGLIGDIFDKFFGLCYPFLWCCCRKDMRVTSAISRRMIDLCTAVPQPQPRPGSVHKEHPFYTGTGPYLIAVRRVVKSNLFSLLLVFRFRKSKTISVPSPSWCIASSEK